MLEDILIKLGVNIDHIATLRNARGDFFPSLIYPANIVEQNGGDFITIHLREDRRHIKDNDLLLLKENITTYLNLEMACNSDVLKKAIEAKPFKVTLVPEKREEITTEGGLDLKNNFLKIKDYILELKNKGISVSVFIEPDISNIDLIVKLNVDDVEVHTGKYANSQHKDKVVELERIRDFSTRAGKEKIKVCAGHGLNYHNTADICKIEQIEELNIGYSIITRSIFDGLGKAVRDMKKIIDGSEKK